MTFLSTLVEHVDRCLRVLLATLMALLVLDVTWQVTTRFILTQPSSFTEEVARFLLIWVSLIGGAYAYRLKSHLGFDLLIRNLSLAKAKFMFRLTCLLVAIFAIAVLIIGGGNLVHLTWTLGQFSPVLNVPMAYIYAVIPFSGVLFLLYSIVFFVDAELHVTHTSSSDDTQGKANG
ncbi:TRAP transporter small permease [Alteromonas sp. KUL49]|uniref:TRAP transporter small permease n=1 Tax=Alteromonas sp. KUL49 TaxID=2480798 RepID=UPI00102F0F34|nr:TRAP transporter small permease [Alteromonas sp. KUL49]TAP42259.1 TRAP transporter small permease [Alteromonas sp. KUL49]GEA09850.1 C4-dicarboxylate ABC transporter permease [Alteromonas sp. KUL49]